MPFGLLRQFSMFNLCSLGRNGFTLLGVKDEIKSILLSLSLLLLVVQSFFIFLLMRKREKREMERCGFGKKTCRNMSSLPTTAFLIPLNEIYCFYLLIPPFFRLDNITHSCASVDRRRRDREGGREMFLRVKVRAKERQS
jgi:hypothetical protein